MVPGEPGTVARGTVARGTVTRGTVTRGTVPERPRPAGRPGWCAERTGAGPQDGQVQRGQVGGWLGAEFVGEP
jgi:hypothetical protein